jgi:signal transduction histidine kinase
VESAQTSSRTRLAGNLALAVALAATLGFMTVQHAREGRVWPVEAAAGLVVGAAALLRERNRPYALGVGLVVSAGAGFAARVEQLPREPDATATLALLVLVVSAVRVLPGGWAPVPALAAMAATAVDWLTVYSPSKAAHGPFIQPGIALWCGALGVGLWLRLADHRRRDTAEAVRRGERIKLARELHDVTAHHITGIVLQAQGARIMARRDPAALDAMLAEIERAGTDALEATRRVVGLLRDTEDAAGTSAGPEQLTELVRRFTELGHGPRVRLHLAGEGSEGWPPEVASTVYRIVQESLTNISRHAPQASSATVSVARDTEGSVTVEVVDDAPAGGTRHPHRGGYGLVGMRERVEALGGSLSVGPGADRGWSVHATLPVPAGGHR